ncbi:MarR family transcriptional regulator [Candidatus Bathyarchaeota archaeon]|nr:MarR family transcriptional regulator [Candidatus Bathyarchaeota archaeon]
MSEDKDEWSKQSDITISTIRSTSKRESCIKILVYLNGNSESRTIQEVSDGLEMDWGTAKHNLTKLTEAGFVIPEEDRMDGRTRHFRILDKKAVEKVIEYAEDRQRKLKKQEEEEKRNPKVPEIKAKPTEVEEVG